MTVLQLIEHIEGMNVAKLLGIIIIIGIIYEAVAFRIKIFATDVIIARREMKKQ